MTILGVSAFFHDSSAALLSNGKFIAGADEERFSRIKHDTSFPDQAIEYCLKSARLKPRDVDYIAFYEKPLRKFERVMAQQLDYFPFSLATFIKAMPSWIKEKLRVGSFMSKNHLNSETFFIPHHLCHAASSFFASPYKKAAVFTIDGVGEWTTTAFGIGEGQKIYLTHELQFPHSIGLLYSTVTAHLGFSVNNSEYKVMGLSAYGDKNRRTNSQYKKMCKLIDIKPDGSFSLDMSYFVYQYKNTMPSEKFLTIFGSARKPKEEIDQKNEDIAAAVQLITEDVYFSILKHIHKVTRQKNICIAGGVALNSVANGLTLSKTPFKNLFIQPASGDGGTSLGAALFTYHHILEHKRKYVMHDCYLGPEFTENYIRHFLRKEHIKHTHFTSRNQLIKTVSNLLIENNVIAWFQGKMEWGPRALGARSILSNPLNPEMQKILNVKVKHREKFRPFAPVVCIDDAPKYFETDIPVPIPTDFMLMVYPVKKRYRTKLPSITHIDGSGRLQTIRRNQNPLYYDLIKEFGKLSGIPILINTSFNIRGEPIVTTLLDAYKCMMGTGIDYLVMGNYLIKRLDNSQHMWDSESLASD